MTVVPVETTLAEELARLRGLRGGIPLMTEEQLFRIQREMRHDLERSAPPAVQLLRESVLENAIREIDNRGGEDQDRA